MQLQPKKPPEVPKDTNNIEAAIDFIAVVQTKITLENPDLFLVALAVISVYSRKVIVCFSQYVIET